MSRSTEQLLPGMIPPKGEAKGAEVDFLGILASVKPETLSEDVLSVFARRDLYVTEADREERKKNSSDWRDQAPVRPVEDRLRMAKISRDSDERDLQDKEDKYHSGAPNGYTRLEEMGLIQMYELIYYLHKTGKYNSKELRTLYKYQYYLTGREKQQNPEWGVFIQKMDELYQRY